MTSPQGIPLTLYLCRPGSELGTLRGILRRSLEGGKRVCVRTDTALLEPLSRDLWLGEQDVLLAHGFADGEFAERQPILLTDAAVAHATPQNGADFAVWHLVPESLPPEQSDRAASGVRSGKGDSSGTQADGKGDAGDDSNGDGKGGGASPERAFVVLQEGTLPANGVDTLQKRGYQVSAWCQSDDGAWVKAQA